MDLKRKKKLSTLISTAGRINNVRIYDVEFKAPFLKIYIDKPGLPVDLKTCEKFMKSLLFLLRSENMPEGECEVSTPGLERKLKNSRHFATAVGERVKIYTRRPVFSYDKKAEKQKQTTILSGQLEKYQEGVISVKDRAVDWKVPLNIITKAHVVFTGSGSSARRVLAIEGGKAGRLNGKVNIRKQNKKGVKGYEHNNKRFF